MHYKILTQNGVNFTNIDEARNYWFNSGGRDGIVKGAFNEGKFITLQGERPNGVLFDTCELRVGGHRIVVDDPWSKTYSSMPSAAERRAVIAEVVVDDNSAVTFRIFDQLESVSPIQNELYKNANGAGTYQVEIGRFTLTTAGLVEDVIRTLDVITGGTNGGGDSSLNIGTVTTTTLDAGLDAEVDIEQRVDPQTHKTMTDFSFAIPKGRDGAEVDSQLSTTSENPVQNKVITNALDNKMDKTNPTGTGSISINRYPNSVVGSDSVAVGEDPIASGRASFACGNGTVASGDSSHSEGLETQASGFGAHAEGSFTTASGGSAHAEGNTNTASGNCSHAEGYGNTASGLHSHVEGNHTTASNNYAHAEGYLTTASGYTSHAAGWGTTAQRRSQHTFGEFNILDTAGGTVSDKGNYIEIVGNGIGDNARSNARTLDWNGNETIAGKHQADGGYTDGKNENYVVQLPDTTGWTENKTFATTDQLTRNTLSVIEDTGSHNYTYSLNNAQRVLIRNYNFTSTGRKAVISFSFDAVVSLGIANVDLWVDGSEKRWEVTRITKNASNNSTDNRVEFTWVIDDLTTGQHTIGIYVDNNSTIPSTLYLRNVSIITTNIYEI